MKYFINLSTRTKLLFSFGLILLMLIIVIIIAYNGIRDIAQSGKDLHDVQFTIDNELSDLRAHQNFNRAEILGMMQTRDKSEQLAIEKTINEKVQEISKIVESLRKLNVDLVFQNQLKELDENLTAYRDTRKEEINFIKAGKIQEAQKLGARIQRERFAKIRSIATDLDTRASNESVKRLTLNQQEADSAILLFEIVGILALVFSILMILLLNRTITKPLNEITKTALQIADGNLSVEVSASERKDEVGILNLAFRQMVEKLRASIKDIIAGVNLLGSSASEILAATTQVASGSAETATAISETTATVEEVRQAAQLSSQKATRVAENAQQVSQVTQTGQKAVDETVSGMNNIQVQMESVAKTIVRLSEQSQQIGGIIASVNDVADQSNLLAVNASIEAAKAGEQGKGFTVVAQEIKSLAQQSKQATVLVRNILIDIQKATSAAVMATEQTSKAVENGVKQSSQAGDSIKKLAESSVRAVEVATQIVASSQQQSVGMDQIGLAMTNINQAGSENAASMLQAEKAAKDLNELGLKLKHLVDQYKL
ncbi:MAG: methyl-accepting chemotaxis protein [Ignavibacteria bacterium]|nr:methyl-accepting chemotaxis protein [Ignavibacteria bacterium]